MVNRTLSAKTLSALAEDLFESNTDISLVARGRSMAPFIRDGDCLTIGRARAEHLRPGDIVFFRAPANRVVLHRLIRKQTRHGVCLLTARGDALTRTCEHFPAEQLLGRVTSIERRGKRVALHGLRWRWASHAWHWAYPLRVLLRAMSRRLRRMTASTSLSGLNSST